MQTPKCLIAAVIHQLNRNPNDPLDCIMDAQGLACGAAEDRFAAFMDGLDEEWYSEIDAPTLCALAITRLIENTTPKELLAFLSPFDPLLRAGAKTVEPPPASPVRAISPTGL
jgi:hypothetical protein